MWAARTRLTRSWLPAATASSAYTSRLPAHRHAKVRRYSLLIHAAGAEDRGEAARRVLVTEGTSLDPGQHLGRAAPTILALQMRPMLLAVEVVDPGRVSLEQILPGPGALEV